VLSCINKRSLAIHVKMKFTLLCIFFLLSAIFAQDCTNVTYTGEPLNCITIDGSLTINSTSDVDGLTNVTNVTGQLYIGSKELTNLNGLSNLKFADSVFISGNNVLNSVYLPSLENTNSIKITHNVNLSSVYFPKLKVVSFFSIMSMFNPAHINSSYVKELKMESLTEITFDFEIENIKYLMNTPLSMEINLDSLSVIGRSLSIKTTGPKHFNNWKLTKVGNFNLENIQGLTSISMNSLTSVNGSINLLFNNDLNEVKLQNLNYISGSVNSKANSTFCLNPTMFGVNLANCTAYNTCNNSHFDTCRTCNLSYWGPNCDNMCNCTGTQLCSSGINGNGACLQGCKDNEMELPNQRCIEKLYFGLIIGGIVLLVTIIIVVIVVAVRNKNKYQKLQ